MNFNDWFRELQTRTARNSGAGLVAFKALLARLNHPQNNYKIIHVAGTNGKGSVCTLVAHTLTCAGHKTGLFVSPHLMSPTERIQINGRAISQEDFKKSVQAVLGAEQEPLNFFELVTAAAFVYFATQKAEYVVLETGLGGRKDPTNICVPVLSMITSVGLDHTQILGDTLAQIAAEKAGIVKPGVPVLCGEVAPEAVQIITQTTRDKNAPIMWVQTGQPFDEIEHDFENGFTLLRLAGKVAWKLHLLGGKQTQNACLVYQAARQLGIGEDALKKAFETVRLPGRFEYIQRGKTRFILDGAHNPQAVENLLMFWQKTPYARQNPTLLCGFMKDKDFRKMLALLAPHFARVIVSMPPSPRAAQKQDFGDLLRTANITFEPDCKAALKEAQKAQVVLCAGSFYLVGAVRRMLNS